MYKSSGILDLSLYYLQLMITMIFAYYSVNNLKEIDFNKRYDLSLTEWTVYAFTPQLFFCTGIVVAFLVYRPETWLIIAMALAAVCQAFTAITEEGGLIKHLFRAIDRADHANAQLAIANSELTASNERLVRAQGQLHLLFEQIEELTLDQERTRIAREIHDGMGQHLLGAKLLAGSLLAENRNDPDRIDLIGAIQAAQNEMLRTISALDQPLQQQSLEERLAEVLHFARLSGLRISFQIAGQARPVSATVRHALGRIAQEALTNAGKYASAKHVLVTLDYTSPDAVALTIADDGQGFAAEIQGDDTGHGLRNMRARAEALGGQCTITSTAQGVTVWTSIPTSAS
ncbi:MAG: hypothetical protein OHK0022_48750 [Roseiflexaceae bacterium]